MGQPPLLTICGIAYLAVCTLVLASKLRTCIGASPFFHYKPKAASVIGSSPSQPQAAPNPTRPDAESAESSAGSNRPKVNKSSEGSSNSGLGRRERRRAIRCRKAVIVARRTPRPRVVAQSPSPTQLPEPRFPPPVPMNTTKCPTQLTHPNDRPIVPSSPSGLGKSLRSPMTAFSVIPGHQQNMMEANPSGGNCTSSGSKGTTSVAVEAHTQLQEVVLPQATARESAPPCSLETQASLSPISDLPQRPYQTSENPATSATTPSVASQLPEPHWLPQNDPVWAPLGAHTLSHTATPFFPFTDWTPQPHKSESVETANPSPSVKAPIAPSVQSHQQALNQPSLFDSYAPEEKLLGDAGNDDQASSLSWWNPSLNTEVNTVEPPPLSVGHEPLAKKHHLSPNHVQQVKGGEPMLQPTTSNTLPIQSSSHSVATRAPIRTPSFAAMLTPLPSTQNNQPPPPPPSPPRQKQQATPPLNWASFLKPSDVPSYTPPSLSSSIPSSNLTLSGKKTESNSNAVTEFLISALAKTYSASRNTTTTTTSTANTNFPTHGAHPSLSSSVGNSPSSSFANVPQPPSSINLATLPTLNQTISSESSGSSELGRASRRYAQLEDNTNTEDPERLVSPEKEEEMLFSMAAANLVDGGCMPSPLTGAKGRTGVTDTPSNSMIVLFAPRYAVLHVSSQWPIKSLSGALAGRMRKGEPVILVISPAGGGVEHANHCAKALCIARSFLKPEGVDLLCRPEWTGSTIALLCIPSTASTDQPKIFSDDLLIRVAGRNAPPPLHTAGLIANRLRNYAFCQLLVMGGEAVLQAMRALCVAHNFLRSDVPVWFLPKFVVMGSPAACRSGMEFHVRQAEPELLNSNAEI